MTRLRIQLLGSFQLYRDDCLIAPEEWPGRKAQQLLKILLTCRGHATPVDQLFEWLWPDLPPASARNSLWVAITHLRRVLEPNLPTPAASTFILTSPAAYRFDSAGRCCIDVDDFLEHQRQGQAAAARGDQAAAIAAFCAAEALYRGDYLAEDRYEEWAISTREHLRETFLDVESALAAQYLGQQREREALVRLHHVLEHDACRESAWRLAMECYYRAGELGQALRAFEQCRAALARELGVDPLPETVALHERILRGGIGRRGAKAPPRPTTLSPAPSPPLPLSPRLPFVGREKEWPALSHLLHEAIRGRGRVVLVRGEPGIGKTRLLEELAGLAVVRGARVLAGSCYELEQNLAYVPILEALRRTLPTRSPSPPPRGPSGHLAAVAEMLPELRHTFPDLPPYQPLPPDEEHLRLLVALTEVIRSSAEGEPLALLLDDLHWADPSTLQLLHYLGRQVLDQPLLLVGAYQSPPVGPQHPLSALRAALDRQGVLTEFTLAALSETDVIVLLRALGGEERGDTFARRLHQDTGGNPFFLTEVLRTFAQEGLITVGADGRWRTAYDEVTRSYQELLLPPSLRAAVLGRLAQLPPEARALLDLASVIGRECPLPLLAHLGDQPEAVVVRQADWLAAGGFLRLGPGGHYEFGHDLTRRVVYEAISEPRRRLLHRQVADALLALRTRPSAEIAGRVATHYAASDRPWLALEHALVAAEQAARIIAYDEAHTWCQQALDVVAAHPTAVPPGFRTRLHLQRRALWYYRGDLERALEADRMALAAARREKDVAAELQALWYLAHDETQVAARADDPACESEHLDRSSSVQEQALTLASGLGDPAAIARSLARLGSDSGFRASPDKREQALGYLEQAVALARQVGDPALLHHVLTELWGVGRLPRARAALEEALVLVRELGDRREEVGTLAKLADLLARQGDFPAAVAYARQGKALAAEIDSPTYGAWNRRALGQALVATGQVPEGVQHLEGAARTFEAHAWPAMLAGTLLRLGLALQMAGAWEPAAEVLQRVLAISQATREPYEAAYALAALAGVRLAQGQTAAGQRGLEQAAELVLRIGLPWHLGGTLVQVAAGRLQLGAIEAALAAADEAICLAEAEDLREVRACGLWRRGLALSALNRKGEAEASLTQGLVQAEAIGHVWLQGQLRQAPADVGAGAA